MYSYRLQVFHAVATAGSLSRAAREILHISQPAVSNHVHALGGCPRINTSSFLSHDL